MILEDRSVNKICNILLAKREEYGEIFLVGGSVRDYLLKNQSHDLDFLVTKNAGKAARCIADSFEGDYYILDKKRETARAIIFLNKTRVIVDVAIISGKNIIEDLEKRDFTINAMALDLAEIHNIIDPLGGKNDLLNHHLIPCSDHSFTDDPVRTLRAVRFIQGLALDYDSRVKQLIVDVSDQLEEISSERIHDELCQIFSLAEVKKSLELLIEFRLFEHLFPDLIQLIDIPAQQPHVYDVFTHTMRVTELTQFFTEIIENSILTNEKGYIQDVQLLVSKYQKELQKYSIDISERKLILKPLMMLAALYHDSGKSCTNSSCDCSIKPFPDHAEKSAAIVYKQMKSLAFANEDIRFVSTIVRNHMAEELKMIGENNELSRNIYRFFRKTGFSGVMVNFLHLADLMATYENNLSPQRWEIALNSVDKILDGWFNHYKDFVSPPKIINGNDLIDKFNLRPGKAIGIILEKIREEQAAGSIIKRNEAFQYAEMIIKDFGYL